MMQANEIKFYIEKSKREEHYTLILQNGEAKKYALSKYAPYKEAEKQIKEHEGNYDTVWIVLGFGLGHIARAILEHINDKAHIIIIEPDASLLKEQLNYEDNNKLISESNIHMFTGEINSSFKKGIEESIPNEQVNNIKFISNPVYLEYYLDYFKEIKDIIHKSVASKITNIATIMRFNELFTENIIKNRKYIEESYQLQAYKGKLKDIPAVIVSAGPSLDKNIQFIKEFKGIVAVGSRTLKSVKEQGVVPDFLFTVDPHNLIYDTLKCDIEDDIKLVVTDSANHKLVSSHKGKKYFVNSVGDAKSLLGADIPCELPMGGSVSTLCMSALAYMGCNPIILIGQDCAYTNMKKHADLCCDEGNDKVAADSHLMVEGYNGDKVQTSEVFLTFLKWFEDFIEQNDECTVINATEGGAYIKGAIHKSFKEVVASYETVNKPNLDEYDTKIKLERDIEERLDELCREFKKLSQIAYRGQRISEGLKVEYEKYKGVRVDRIRKKVKELNRIDKELVSDSKVNDITAVIFSALQSETNLKVKRALGNDIEQEGIEIAENSYQLYWNIEQALLKYIDIIEKSR